MKPGALASRLWSLGMGDRAGGVLSAVGTGHLLRWAGAVPGRTEPYRARPRSAPPRLPPGGGGRGPGGAGLTARHITARLGTARLASPAMASKCPKCDKTVYFGERIPPRVAFPHPRALLELALIPASPFPEPRCVPACPFPPPG